MAISKKGNLASQFEVVLTVNLVEASRRRTGQHIHADSLHHGPLERFAAVLAKPRYVKLDDRTGSPVGRCKRFIATRPDISINPGLAVAHDRTRCVPCRRCAGMIEPLSIAGGDQDFAKDTAKTFSVGIINDGSMTHPWAPLPFP